MDTIMTNEEILQKAIDKAVKSGFKPFTTPSWFDVIYDHRFAKAFFGEEEYGWFKGYNEWSTIDPRDLHEDSDLTELRMPEWKVRLQQMVIREDPIKYLESYL